MPAACAILVLLTGCQAPQTVHHDDSASIGLARVNRLMGVQARSYAFQLQPHQSLLVACQAQRNGVDDPQNTFTHVVEFSVYATHDRNYPSFDRLQGKRLVDIEILKPGHSWNQEFVKVSVRMPGFERYVYFREPTNSSAAFGGEPWITPEGRNVLLNLRYREPNGDTRTLTVEAEIRSQRNPP